ncbi:MAG TPA: hypothetical protein VF487_16300 [Chitinophagaceae bacterium]
MKKYLLGLFAVVLALAAVSFTTKKATNSKLQARYWFNASNSATTPTSATLIAIQDVNNDGLPNEVPFSDTDPYGCVLGEDFVCAVAYDDASELTRFQSGSNFYFLPTTQSTYDDVRTKVE